MTIDDAIRLLTELKAKHTGGIHVYFDCPLCRQSFPPSMVVAVAVHLTEKEKKT